MKTKTIVTMVAVAFLSITTAFGQAKTEKINVAGNCGMCKTRIEKAANGVDGVSSAVWDKESKKMTVSFDESKTSVDKIEMAVATVGHDTDMHKAKDEVYNKLPGCCKYDRSGAESTKDHAGHSM